MDGNMSGLSPGLFQPIAADDVAAIVVRVAIAAPGNGIVEIAGPERAPFQGKSSPRYLKAVSDPREVVSDPQGPILLRPDRRALLVPLAEARLGRIRFDEWLRLIERSPIPIMATEG